MAYLALEILAGLCLPPLLPFRLQVSFPVEVMSVFACSIHISRTSQFYRYRTVRVRYFDARSMHFLGRNTMGPIHGTTNHRA